MSASEGFAEIYDLPADELATILADDVAAMLFGFRFLRQVLFGEATIPMHAGNVEQRRARAAAQRARLEREAAARIARDEDGGGDDE